MGISRAIEGKTKNLVLTEGKTKSLVLTEGKTKNLVLTALEAEEKWRQRKRS